MGDEKPQDPFDPYVQELQKQEGEIERKLGTIEEIVKDLDFADPQTEAALRERMDEAKRALDKLKEDIAKRKIEDLEKELEELKGFVQNPGRFNPQPVPPWLWPWPWPPPPGFPGPGSGTPGVINVGIVTLSAISSPRAARARCGCGIWRASPGRRISTPAEKSSPATRWTARSRS